MEAPNSLSSLKKAVKDAELGTGAVRKVIHSSSYFITGRDFTRLIRACRNTRQWERALEILEAACGCDPAVGAPPSFYTFSAAISVCSKSGRLVETLLLFHKMKEAAVWDPSFCPHTTVYRLVILCCVRQGEIQIARNLLDEMSMEGMELDNDTLKHIMLLLMNLRAWEHATDVLDELHGRGVLLASGVYSNMIRSAAGAGNVEIATNVFLMMQMAGAKADSCTCHHVMLALQSCSQVDLGLQLLSSMQESGIDVYPKTYACLLGMGAGIRMLQKAMGTIEA